MDFRLIATRKILNLLTFMLRSFKTELCPFWREKLSRSWNPFKTRFPPLSFYYKEQPTANSSSFKIAQNSALEAKERLYTTGKVVQRLFIIDWERFSFECRKVISFAFTTLHDWLKQFAPIFYPIRSKTKTNRHSLARVFPRFASATCNYFEVWWNRELTLKCKFKC